MRYLKGFIKKASLAGVIISVMLIFSCNLHQKSDISESPGQIQTITLPYSVLDKGSLQRFYPGRDGTPQPEIIHLKPFTRKSIHNNKVLAGAPQKVLAAKPKVNKIGEGRFLAPEAIEAIHHPVLAVFPESVVAKAPCVHNPNPMNFSKYSKLQGLSNNVVRSIIEDRNGNLWFATNGGGVTKFDGRSFYHYTEKHGLTNAIVWSLLEDRHGNIWMGTWGGGISRYDGKYFTHYSRNEGLSGNYITCLMEDHSGKIWVGTNNGGISVFDGEEFIHYTQNQGLPSDRIYSILQDNSLNIWIATSTGGVCRFDGSSFTVYDESVGLLNNLVWNVFEDSQSNIWLGTRDGAVKFDGTYFTNYTTKQGLSDNRIWIITEDKEGNMWFGTRGGGACMYDGRFFWHHAEKEGFSATSVLAVHEDKAGVLWFGTFGAGVMKYNGNTFKHLTDNEGLPFNEFRVITQDSRGNFWIGTWGGGIVKYDGQTVSSFEPVKGILPGIVNAIVEDHKGNIWFGTQEGLYCFDGVKLIRYSEKHGLPANLVWTIMEDSRNNLWIGTAMGIVIFDGESFMQITEKDGLPHPRTWAVHEDTRGNIWIGTYGGGAVRFDGNGIAYFGTNEGLANDFILSINEDMHERIWMGTNGGITVLKQISSETDDRSAISQVVSSHQNIFEVVSISEKHGLQGNTVADILVDKSGNIVLGTDFGLSILSAQDANNMVEMLGKGIYKEKPLFRNFGFEDGFLGVGVSANNAMLEARNGDIWIATDSRLITYYPTNPVPEDRPPVIQLAKIELFNETIKWSELVNQPLLITNEEKRQNVANDTSFVLGNGVRLHNFRFSSISPWFEIPENLNLAYNNNFLTFHFMGITQRQPSLVKYKYKLDGLDENWSAVTSRNTAPYGNLPPGKFVFKVKAMNSSGQWSDEYSYSFTIRPPWWLTWWFRILVAISSIALLLFIYKFRLANLKRRKAELEQLVEQKTIEVIQKNEALQSLNEELTSTNEEIHAQRDALEEALNNLKQAQKRIVHSEKMASLGVLAAGLAHEINNPLNFIKGGVVGIEEYLKDNILEHYKELQPLIEVINVGVSRAAIIVKSLNHFNRSNDTTFARADIHSIIDDCLIILHNKLKYKVEVVKDYTDKPHRLVCNVGRLHQAILHILTNSEQAIAQKGKITISTHILNDHLKLTISDTGHGIHAANLKKVLDPFFTTKEPGKGSGLGLTITYTIIQEHGGTIEIDSVHDSGTSVTIQIPLNKPEGPMQDE